METHNTLETVQHIGIAPDDAKALRRISMTLRNWHERVCGTDHGCIERNEETGKPYFVTWYTTGQNLRRLSYPVPDRETGALKRLSKIMERYPDFTPYVQGDPRGCALYILRPGDVPEGRDPECCYSRGIPVY